jgi:hypothetical protein
MTAKREAVASPRSDQAVERSNPANPRLPGAAEAALRRPDGATRPHIISRPSIVGCATEQRV